MPSSKNFLRIAALSAAFLATACSSDDALAPSDALLSKGRPVGPGWIHWLPGTGFDPATLTFSYRGHAHKDQHDSFTITVSANVTAAYDCANGGGEVLLAGASAGSAEAIANASTLPMVHGRISGSVSLDLGSAGILSCPAPDGIGQLQAANVEILSVQSVTVTVAPVVAKTLTYTF